MSVRNKSPFTPEELAEMAAADAEIEAQFSLDQADIDFSRKLDKAARLDGLSHKERKAAIYKMSYYEANREKISAHKKAYYEANRDRIAARNKAYREANLEKCRSYMREYMRRRRKGDKRDTA